MNIHLPSILMFTRVPGFWPMAIWYQTQAKSSSIAFSFRTTPHGFPWFVGVEIESIRNCHHLMMFLATSCYYNLILLPSRDPLTHVPSNNSARWMLGKSDKRFLDGFRSEFSASRVKSWKNWSGCGEGLPTPWTSADSMPSAHRYLPQASLTQKCQKNCPLPILAFSLASPASVSHNCNRDPQKVSCLLVVRNNRRLKPGSSLQWFVLPFFVRAKKLMGRLCPAMGKRFKYAPKTSVWTLSMPIKGHPEVQPPFGMNARTETKHPEIAQITGPGLSHSWKPIRSNGPFCRSRL